MLLFADFDGGPPCSQCEKPENSLSPEGETALSVWQELDFHDRQYWANDGMPLPLPLNSIRQAVRDYGLSMEMQGLIISLEQAVLQMRQEDHKKKNKAGK